MNKLYEADHPYYCSDVDAPKGYNQSYSSWRGFVSEYGNPDVDMNLVVRWDWYTEEKDEWSEPELRMVMLKQRKGFIHSLSVKVKPEDEPAIREWLQPHINRIAENWHPLRAQEPTP